MSYCNYSSLIPLCNMTFGITLQIAGKGLSYILHICHWVSNWDFKVAMTLGGSSNPGSFAKQMFTPMKLSRQKQPPTPWTSIPTPLKNKAFESNTPHLCGQCPMSLRSFAMLKSGRLPAFGTVCSTLSTFTPHNFHKPIYIYIYISIIFSCSNAYIKDLSLGEKFSMLMAFIKRSGLSTAIIAILASVWGGSEVISRSFSSAVLSFPLSYVALLSHASAATLWVISSLYPISCTSATPFLSKSFLSSSSLASMCYCAPCTNDSRQSCSMESHYHIHLTTLKI